MSRQKRRRPKSSGRRGWLDPFIDRNPKWDAMIRALAAAEKNIKSVVFKDNSCSLNFRLYKILKVYYY